MPPPPTDDEKNIKNKAFQQHLKEWQKKHNLLADDENDNSVQVLFGDVWQQTAEDRLRSEEQRETCRDPFESAGSGKGPGRMQGQDRETE